MIVRNDDMRASTEPRYHERNTCTSGDSRVAVSAVRTDVQTMDANSEELACIAYCTDIVLVMKATDHVKTHTRIVA